MSKLCLVFLVYLIAACASTSAARYSSDYGAGINVTAEVTAFVSGNHDLEYCGDYLCLIDGAPFWGSDGKIPQHILTKLVVGVGKNSVVLNTEGMYNPIISAETLKKRIHVRHSWGEAYRVSAELSDGAGGYIAEWLVIKGKAVRTFIGDRESLADLVSP